MKNDSNKKKSFLNYIIQETKERKLITFERMFSFVYKVGRKSRNT